MIQDINVQTLKHWLETAEAVVVDVREPSEHRTGVIPHAILLPLGEVSKEQLLGVKGKKLVMLCRSGKRSQAAGEILLAQDPEFKVFNLAGGILQWAAEGNHIQVVI